MIFNQTNHNAGDVVNETPVVNRCRELLQYLEGVNKMFMREFERAGYWPEAASESVRLEKMLRYALAGEDPLQDERGRNDDDGTDPS